MSSPQAPRLLCNGDATLSQVLRILPADDRNRIRLNDIIGPPGDRSFVSLLTVFAIPNLFSFIPGGTVMINCAG